MTLLYRQFAKTKARKGCRSGQSHVPKTHRPGFARVLWVLGTQTATFDQHLERSGGGKESGLKQLAAAQSKGAAQFVINYATCNSPRMSSNRGDWAVSSGVETLQATSLQIPQSTSRLKSTLRKARKAINNGL